jgi:MobA-like NTP transferase domain
VIDRVGPPLVVLAAGLARRYGGCKPLAPIGPSGEAVVDLLASDAVGAGFGRILLVLHPETGPAVRYHIEQCWPRSVPVEFAVQRLPLGTVHAVLAAGDLLGEDESFGVANADDVYGERAMRLLVDRLGSDAAEHVLIGYPLSATVVTDDPVTRGICDVGPDGRLISLTERRKVTRQGEGEPFLALDGLEPETLPASLPSSVNLWGFRSAIWDVFGAAMAASGLDEEALLAEVAAGREVPKAEVLLPEVVSTMVAEASGLPVRVVTTDAKLVGVTHASDLPVASAELSRQVACGIRPERLWPTVG